ncbi:MAG: anaerobic magnesium-protoporphyrin monomethyl ester cyclase [Thermodesulfobacteriota bacterium]|nr:anaerobic magnesium-protoporphyrin monomethyl ester cyclase [Thermodesulfobacteriota bacterium]
MIAECLPEIALVHPPAISKRYLRTKFMPYGMAVVYAFLKEHNIPVIQYDFLMEYLFDSPDDINFHGSDHSFSERDFFAYLEGSAEHPGLAHFTRKYGDRITSGAKIYGFSIVAYHQYWASLLLAKYLREQNPEAIIVFGGPFVTIKPAEALAGFGQAHYWIKGSGEIPLFLLYKSLRNGSTVSLEEVPGLLFKNGNTIHQAPKSRFPAEEERCPDFEGLDLDSYRYNHPVTGDKTFFMPYRLSKGCPSRCSFCTGRLIDSYDYKSPQKVISDLEVLCHKYASTNFQFADASVNGNPHQLSAVCDLIQAHLGEIRWYAYARVSGFDEQLLQKVKKAGCFSLFWGIESAHQPTINLLGKRFKADRMYEILDYSISLGLRNFIHIMYNTPHESKDDIQAFQYLIHRYVLNPEVVFLPQRFLLEPQSYLQENPGEFGISRIKPIEKGVFEREEYIYCEAAGLDYQDVNERNIAHQEELSECLELIRLMNWRRDSGGFMKRLVPARFLVHLVHFRHIGLISEALYDKLFRPLTIPRQSLKEQL